jgi:hypothetical protein
VTASDTLAARLETFTESRRAPFRGSPTPLHGCELPADYWAVLRLCDGFSSLRNEFRLFSLEDARAWNAGPWRDAFSEEARGFVAVAVDVFGDVYGYAFGRSEGPWLAKFSCEGGHVQRFGSKDLERFLVSHVLCSEPDAFGSSLARRAGTAGLQPGAGEFLGFAVPLVAGGECALRNLEVQSGAMLYGVLGQLSRASNAVPDGTRIGAFVDQPFGDPHAFWAWFGDRVVPSLEEDRLPSDAVIDRLDAALVGFGLSWELGPAPGGREGWMFAVSFGADLQRLKRARLLADAAPRFDCCEILLGKPPKDWDGTLEMSRGDGVVCLSTATWQCALVDGEGGWLVLVAPQGEVHGASEEALERAASIAVWSELGELRFATCVRAVEVVSPEALEGMVGSVCTLSPLRAVVDASTSAR